MRKLVIISAIAILIGVFPKGKLEKLSAAPSPVITKMGKASWYSRRSPGINRTTASNEKFDDTAMTCAMWGVPFNQYVKVTNLANGKSIVVRVNDRGPHKRFVRTGRIIDLTKEAFSKLELTKEGLINVQIELL